MFTKDNSEKLEASVKELYFDNYPFSDAKKIFWENEKSIYSGLK